MANIVNVLVAVQGKDAKASNGLAHSLDKLLAAE
jgi:hypothetical protein